MLTYIICSISQKININLLNAIQPEVYIQVFSVGRCLSINIYYKALSTISQTILIDKYRHIPRCFIRHSSYILTIMHWHIQRQHYYMHQTPEYYWLYNQDEYQSLQRHNVFYFHHNFLLPLYRKQLYLFPLQKQ